MATIDDIKKKLEAFCQQDKTYVYRAGAGPLGIEYILSHNGDPATLDTAIWIEDGKVRTNNDIMLMQVMEASESEPEKVEVIKGSNSARSPEVKANMPAIHRKGQDAAIVASPIDSWRGRQDRSYSVAGKTVPNAFGASEQANKRNLNTQIIDAGRTKNLVWGHVRVTDPSTGQFREDRVSHDRETFCLLKSWEDANSQVKYQKPGQPNLIIGIRENNMPELNPDIKIKGMPAPLWLTMQIMRSWSFADRDAITKAERRAQLKIMNREWRDNDEIELEIEEERAVSGE